MKPETNKIIYALFMNAGNVLLKNIEENKDVAQNEKRAEAILKAFYDFKKYTEGANDYRPVYDGKDEKYYTDDR